MKLSDVVLNILILVLLPFVIGWCGAGVIMTDFSGSMFIIIIGIFVGFTLHKIFFRDYHGVSHTDEPNDNEDLDMDDLELK